MKNIEQRFILLLSDPSQNKKKVDDFYKWLNKGGLDICYNKAVKIRAILSDFDSNNIDLNDNSISSYQIKIINEVDNILRKEAGMTAKDAINALVRELRINIPTGRKSFRDQILYISEKVEGPVIINTAYKIMKIGLLRKSDSDYA